MVERDGTPMISADATDFETWVEPSAVPGENLFECEGLRTPDEKLLGPLREVVPMYEGGVAGMILERTAKWNNLGIGSDWHGFGRTIEGGDEAGIVVTIFLYRDAKILAKFAFDSNFVEIEYSRMDFGGYFGNLRPEDFKLN